MEYKNWIYEKRGTFIGFILGLIVPLVISVFTLWWWAFFLIVSFDFLQSLILSIIFFSLAGLFVGRTISVKKRKETYTHLFLQLGFVFIFLVALFVTYFSLVTMLWNNLPASYNFISFFFNQYWTNNGWFASLVLITISSFIGFVVDLIKKNTKIETNLKQIRKDLLIYSITVFSLFVLFGLMVYFQSNRYPSSCSFSLHKDECYSSVAFNLVNFNKLDISLCHKMNDLLYKDRCLIILALQNKTLDGCEKVQNRRMKDICLGYFAQRLKNENICDNMKYYSRSECLGWINSHGSVPSYSPNAID